MSEEQVTKPASENSVREKHELIANVIANMIELGDYLKVNPDGTISYLTKPDVPILYKQNGSDQPQPLINYTTKKVQKSIMVNPFVETIGTDSMEKVWLFHTTNIIHTSIFSRILEYLFENVVKAGKGEQLDHPSLMHVLSGVANYADVKTEAEFAKLVKALPEYEGELDDKMIRECGLVTNHPKPKDFISITRNKAKKASWITVFLADDESQLKKRLGSKVRVKTWKLIEQLIREIYAVDDITKPIYYTESTSGKCPSFITYLTVLVKSWNRFIPYLEPVLGSEERVEENVNRIIFLESVLPRLEELASYAVWARSSARNGVVEQKPIGQQVITLSADDDSTKVIQENDKSPAKRRAPDGKDVRDEEKDMRDERGDYQDNRDHEIERRPKSTFDVMERESNRYYSDRRRDYDYRDGRYGRGDYRDYRYDDRRDSRYGGRYDRDDRYDDRNYSPAYREQESRRFEFRPSARDLNTSRTRSTASTFEVLNREDSRYRSGGRDERRPFYDRRRSGRPIF